MIYYLNKVLLELGNSNFQTLEKYEDQSYYTELTQIRKKLLKHQYRLFLSGNMSKDKVLRRRIENI